MPTKLGWVLVEKEMKKPIFAVDNEITFFTSKLAASFWVNQGEKVVRARLTWNEAGVTVRR